MLKSIKTSYYIWLQIILGCLTCGGIVLLINPTSQAQGINPESVRLPQLQPWIFQGVDAKPSKSSPNKLPSKLDSKEIDELGNTGIVPITPPSIILNRPGIDRLSEDRLQELSQPDIKNPVLTPPFRLPENNTEGRLHLAKSAIISEEKDGVTRHWMTGKLANLTNGWVKDVVIHYKIRDEFWILQSGHFSVNTECVSFGLQCLEFKFPLRHTGKLEISFVQWKYQDGSTGVSKGGVF